MTPYLNIVQAMLRLSEGKTIIGIAGDLSSGCWFQLHGETLVIASGEQGDAVEAFVRYSKFVVATEEQEASL